MSEPLLRPARVKHFCNIGDIIASLVAMKEYHRKTNRKIIYCQQLNVPATYYEGAVHPTRDGKGNMVMCNQKMFDMIKPLLLAQDYIEDMEIFEGQPVAFDLDKIRKEIFVNLPHQAIQQWVFMAFPDLACDITKAWINVPDDVDISDCSITVENIVTQNLPLPELSDKIIVNFTERYRNLHINYFFLRNYQNNLLFAGTEQEHKIFCETWGISIPRINVNNFLQLAFILKKCKFLMGNQSFLWNVSFAIKTPHVLEYCEHAPNCQAFTYDKSFGFLNQHGLKYSFETLIKS